MGRPADRPAYSGNFTTRNWRYFSPLMLGGMAVTLLPLVCALYFGRYVLKLNPILLLGACAGAQTVTAAMAEVQEKSGSRTPVLGYTVPYAIGNILLTIWGSIIVTLLS